MGELDEHETVPPAGETPTEVSAPQSAKVTNGNDTPGSETENLFVKTTPTTTTTTNDVVVTIEKPIVDDKKDIDIASKTNSTNKNPKDEITKPPVPVTQEGREVKPKKIPIGGIKMPGFFTKTKPKEEGDGADGELLEKAGAVNEKEEKAAEAADESKTDKTTKPNFFQSLKLRNPFAKRQQQPVKQEDQDNNEAQENSNFIYFCFRFICFRIIKYCVCVCFFFRR